MDRFSEMQIFARAVELGGFSAAARAMSLTPSGVSKVVARLEDRLKVLLFKRNSRTTTLTPEGQAYYEQVLTILEAVEHADAVVSGSLPKKETLRVFSPLAVCCHQLAPLMPEFNARYPDLKVELITGRGPIGKLDSTIDVAVYPSDLQDSSLIARKLADCGWVVCAAPGYLEKHGTPQLPNDLLDHNCLNFTMDVPCNTWRVSDGQESLPLSVGGSILATDAETLLALAKAGAGIVRLLEYVVSRDIEEGKLVPLFNDRASGPTQPIYAVFQTRRHLAPRVRVFLDFLEEALKRQPWSRLRRSPERPPLRSVA